MPSLLPLLTDTELLARLVGFDTTSHNSNLPLADFLCDYLDRPGVRIARNPSADGAKTNVVACGEALGLQRRDERVRRGQIGARVGDEYLELVVRILGSSHVVRSGS